MPMCSVLMIIPKWLQFGVMVDTMEQALQVVHLIQLGQESLGKWKDFKHYNLLRLRLMLAELFMKYLMPLRKKQIRIFKEFMIIQHNLPHDIHLMVRLLILILYQLIHA